LSLILLAETIDSLVEARQAFVAESEAIVTVSNLSAINSSELRTLCGSLGWHTQLFDSADEVWQDSERPSSGFAPFRLVISEPSSPADTLQLLSNHAFAYWLDNGHKASRWHMAKFTGTLITGSQIIQAWGGSDVANQLPLTKSPRALVREFGNVRKVPQDIRPWLTDALGGEQFAQPTTQVWVRAASVALINCLPDEINNTDGALNFRGPPRLILPRLKATEASLDRATFNILLLTLLWIFENEREAEMRHVLLSAELTRSGKLEENTPAFLCKHLAHAKECAQIAYQMVLSDTSRDTLKALTELRKTVTEETHKLSDISRQLAGSVTAALAAGIGLIAIRIAMNTSVVLVGAIIFVIVIYISMVISSGMQFMRLQRELREQWQPKLYRFLSIEEYDLMVTKPIEKAERSFMRVAFLGGSAIFLWVAVCIFFILITTSQVELLETKLASPPLQSKSESPAINPVP